MQPYRLVRIYVLPLAYLTLCAFKTPDPEQFVGPIAPPKELDLSLPPTTADQLKPSALNASKLDNDNFVVKYKKKERSVQLDGSVLMSQELEAEKRRTLDGAGIVLKLSQ